MPTKPSTPTTNASVDRLTLAIDSPRGTQPSAGGPQGFMACFCLDASASAVIFGCFGTACFEMD